MNQNLSPKNFTPILSIIIIWLWNQSSALNQYNLQLTGALILLYFGSKFFLRLIGRKENLNISSFILTNLCLLTVFGSGGLASPLFFVLVLLIFAQALLFSPSHAITSSLLLSVIFIWELQADLDTIQILNLIFLLLTTPLAIKFGQIYLENLSAKGQVKVLENIIQNEETDSLLWISTTAKPSIASVLNATTDLVLYLNSQSHKIVFPKALHEKLKSVQNDLVTLYTSVNALESSIKQESDNNDFMDKK